MRQLFRLTLTSIAARFLFNPPHLLASSTTKKLTKFEKFRKNHKNVISSRKISIEEVQKKVEDIISSRKISIQDFPGHLKNKAKIENVIIIREVPWDLFELTALHKRTEYTAVHLPPSATTIFDQNKNLLDEATPENTLIMDFKLDRLQPLYGKFPLLAITELFSAKDIRVLRGLPGFADVRDAARQEERELTPVEKTQQVIDDLVGKPHTSNTSFVEDIVANLQEAQIKQVFIVSYEPLELLQLRKSVPKKFKLILFRVPLHASNILTLLKGAKLDELTKEKTLVMDFDYKRLLELSPEYPTLVAPKDFTANRIRIFRKFPDDSSKVDQEYLNQFIKDNTETLTAESLAQFLLEAEVKALAVVYEGAAVPGAALLLESDALRGEPSVYPAAPDFVEFVREAQRLGLPVYIVTFSDQKEADLKNKSDLENKADLENESSPPKNYVAGKQIVLRLLRLRDVFPDGVIAYNPEYYVNPGEYQQVNPEAGKDEKMPGGKTFHLMKVRDATALLPQQILLMDNNPCHCQNAVRDDYRALHVDTPTGGEGFVGFSFKALRGVERPTGAAASVCA